MKRIEKFGSLSANQKLNFFKNELENEEVLLFQYYETGNNDNNGEAVTKTLSLQAGDKIIIKINFEGLNVTVTKA